VFNGSVAYKYNGQVSKSSVRQFVKQDHRTAEPLSGLSSPFGPA
jgi:hypothetical protein